MQKEPLVSFVENVYLLFMYIIWRLICEILSRIAVIMSFLWGPKDCVYAAVSFATSVTSWYLRNNMQNFTSVYLYINIILWMA